MKKFASALFLCAAISAPAFAANAGTSYVALDYGQWSMANSQYNNPGVLTIAGGYHFTPNLGAEVGYAWVGDSTLYSLGGGSWTLSQSAIKVAAVGTLPVAPQFDIFGKLGFAVLSAKIVDPFGRMNSASNTNLLYGIGAQYNVSNQVGVRLQYEGLGKAKASATDPGADVTSLSVGVVFGF